MRVEAFKARKPAQEVRVSKRKGEVHLPLWFARGLSKLFVAHALEKSFADVCTHERPLARNAASQQTRRWLTRCDVPAYLTRSLASLSFSHGR